ncbi:MAG: DJ-1/PfpI family protein [Kiritimatiellia bacterium]
MKKDVTVVLYDDFTALDVFGPVEVLGKIASYDIGYASLHGGIVRNQQGIRIETRAMETVGTSEILLIPGGYGSRKVIQNVEFIGQLRRLMGQSKYVLCVCTGSALAAATGLLDGKKATSNTRAMDWVKSQGRNVRWEGDSRWVIDGNIYTSAGVSAGTDMALGFVRDKFGKPEALRICNAMEYNWNVGAARTACEY